MDFELDDDQCAWRDEIRAFLSENVTDQLPYEEARHGSEEPGSATLEFRRRIGEKGD
ncbi:MAG: hypothetical protein QOE61_3643 [Micromonosporaceae bacterium]|nr:hypothetical protein [Micromonosporaceae bacterium]